MKLYYVPMTRSNRPRWLLEELGAPYEIVRLDIGAKENRRAAYLQWTVFATVSAEKAVEQFHEHTLVLPEEDRQPRVAEMARARFHELADVVQAALGERDFLVGNRFTTADLMMGSVLTWARMLGLLADHPQLETYSRKQTGRPAAKRARA